jgi:hypothetical protein
MRNSFLIKDDYVIVYLNWKGKTVEMFVDLDDLSLLSEYDSTFYAVDLNQRGDLYCLFSKTINKVKTTKLIHRLITNASDGLVVDHVNHNTLDNRKINLRVVNQLENMQNYVKKELNTSSGVRGVSFDIKHGKWRARRQFNKKTISLGYFETIDAAKQALLKYEQGVKK